MFHSVADLEANYRRFVERATAKEIVYYLSSPQKELILLGTHTERFKPDMPIVPVWSDLPYAQRGQARMEEVKRPCKVVAIPTAIFAEDMLLAMQQKGYLVGPNWNADFAGLESVPVDLAEDLFVANGQSNIGFNWPWHENFDSPEE